MLAIDVRGLHKNYGPLTAVDGLSFQVRSGEVFAGGTGGVGLTATATEWFIPEGATGTWFDLYVLVGNPSASDAELQVTYLLPNGSSFETVPGARAKPSHHLGQGGGSAAGVDRRVGVRGDNGLAEGAIAIDEDLVVERGDQDLPSASRDRRDRWRGDDCWSDDDNGNRQDPSRTKTTVAEHDVPPQTPLRSTTATPMPISTIRARLR